VFDEVFDLIADAVLGFVPNVVLGALTLLVGLAMTAIGIATVGEPGLWGEVLTVVGLSAVVGVLALRYR